MRTTAAFLITLAIACPAPGQAAPAWKTFGPSKGMVSEYQVSIYIKRDGREQELTRPFTVQAFRASEEAGRVAVIRPDLDDSAAGAGIPILIYRLASNGSTVPDPIHDREMLRSLLAQGLFTGLPAACSASGSKWKEDCATVGGLAIAAVLEHKVERGADVAGGRAGSIRLTSQRIRSSSAAAAAPTNVKGWEREVVADESTGRPLTATVAVEFESKGASGDADDAPGTIRYRMELEESSRRPLARAEDAGLGREIVQLEEVIHAADGQKAGEQGKNPRSGAGPLALLDAYEKAHPRGILRSVSGPLRVALTGRASPAPAVRNDTELAERTAPPRPAAEEIESRKASLIGGPAPAFTLKDLGGKPVSLGDFQGQVVLLVFWGVGCGPCRAEAPYLSELQEAYGDQGLIVLAVNGYDESREVVEGFVREKKLLQKVLLQGRKVAIGQYFVEGYPTLFLIDRQGRVVERDVGFSPSKVPVLKAKVKQLLNRRD